MNHYINVIKYMALLFSVCVLTLISGCGGPAPEASIEDSAYTPKATEEITKKETDTDFDIENIPTLPASQEDADSPQSESDSSAIKQSPLEITDTQTDDSLIEVPPGGRRLTENELQIYTGLLQQPFNYGFLLSDWEVPTEVNLYEVFYSGAGISRDGTEAEIQAFLKRNGQEELYTDFFAMDKAAVSNLLLEKIGLTYDEFVMKGGNGMEASYYAESDSFLMEVGDTNFCLFECTDGVENEEGTIVTLCYKGDFWVQKGEVKMWKDGISICSNHILEGEILNTLE